MSRTDAQAFAAWRGMRLPTELEWERGARGSTGYRYPWGNDWDRLRANTLELELFDTTRVGTFEGGRSPEGCYDVEGNVWEWTSEEGGLLKGGSFWTPREKRRVSKELHLELRLDPSVRAVDIGFRCAADAEGYFERSLRLAAEAGAGERATLRRIAWNWGPRAAEVLRAVAGRPGVREAIALEMARAAESAGPPR